MSHHCSRLHRRRVPEEGRVRMRVPYDKVAGGCRLKKLRDSRGMTLESLGKELGRSPGAVCLYEKGKMGLTYEMAIRYSEVFGMSLDGFTEYLSKAEETKRSA